MSDSQRLSLSVKPAGIFVLVIILLIIGLAIMGVVHFFSPIPAADVTQSAQNLVLPGQFSVTFPGQAESAVGTASFGVISSSPDQTPIPIASVTKIMTAYLVLKAHPLKPGEDGPSLTMTAQDVHVSQPIQVFGYPGMKVSYSIKPLPLKLPTAPGTNVATLTIQTGKTSQTVPMQNKEQIDAPGLLWRVIR